ncbi:MAG: hypothetical protein ABIK07_12970 [Planctomycetota bacterium]
MIAYLLAVPGYGFTQGPERNASPSLSEDPPVQATIPSPADAEGVEKVKTSALLEESKPEMNRPSAWGGPTEVQIIVFVIDIDEVNSADQSFAASIYYEAH